MRAKKLINISNLLIFVGILFLVDASLTVIYRSSFWWFSLVVGVSFIFLAVLYKKFKNHTFSPAGKVILKFVRILILISLIIFIAIEGLLIKSSFTKDKSVPDYVLILGAGLWGESPSFIALNRLDSSLELLNTLPKDTKIVVSGGMGSGETITEAEAMKRYLMKNGIAEKRIIKEDKSTTTKENMNFTYNLLSKIDGRKDLKITIVTNNFHMYRSTLLAKRAGFTTVYNYCAPTYKPLEPKYYIREALALIKAVFN